MNRINFNQTATMPITFFVIAFSILWSSPQALSQNNVESIEQITSAVRNPEMKKRWENAYNNGTLPPLNTLPIPSQPVSQRQAIKMPSDLEVPYKRPVIAESVPIDVQIYTKDLKLTKYRGKYEVVSHRDGVLVGKIDNSKETFEILYKLPQTKHAEIVIAAPNLFLEYHNYLSESAIQRRIVLYDQETKIPKIISIAEGSETPYRMILSEIGLTIVQNVQPNNDDDPSITINYNGQSVTLLPGDEKSIGRGNNALRIHILSSYAYNPKEELLLEGQPYYVNIIIYK